MIFVKNRRNAWIYNPFPWWHTKPGVPDCRAKHNNLPLYYIKNLHLREIKMSLIHWKWCALKLAWRNLNYYRCVCLWKSKTPKSSPTKFGCLAEVWTIRYSGPQSSDFAIALRRCLLNTCWWLHELIESVLADAYNVYFGEIWSFKVLRHIKVYWEVTPCQWVKSSRRFDRLQCVFLRAKHCCVFRQTFLQVSNL